MSDQPKRRGRPPKVRVETFRGIPVPLKPFGDPAAGGGASTVCEPTCVLRIKAGALQQAWQHATGTQWRQVPVVPADAPDWEDA